MKRRAFTMIELLTVVGIIVILGGLLVIGIGKLHASAKRTQTTGVLNNAQAMLADLQATLHSSYRAAGPMACPQNVTDDYYKTFEGSSSDPSSNATRPASYRYGNAVLLTRDMLFLLRSLPGNAASFGKLSAETTLALPGPKSVNSTSSTYTFLMPTAPSFAAGNYAVGDRVQIADPVVAGKFETFASLRKFTATATDGPPKEGYWVLEPDKTVQVPLILDAWGNPIIFVPSVLGANTPYTTGAIPLGDLVAGNIAIYQSASGAQANTVANPTGGQPFFASAGPDGDFSTGDDNVYSFEK